MNKRIQQLYLQAHEQEPIIVMDSETCEPTHKLGHGGVPMYHMVFNPEKFAELIVKECARVITNGGYWTDILGNRKNASPDEISQMVKEHFGVEE